MGSIRHVDRATGRTVFFLKGNYEHFTEDAKDIVGPRRAYEERKDMDIPTQGVAASMIRIAEDYPYVPPSNDTPPVLVQQTPTPDQQPTQATTTGGEESEITIGETPEDGNTDVVGPSRRRSTRGATQYYGQ